MKIVSPIPRNKEDVTYWIFLVDDLEQKFDDKSIANSKYDINASQPKCVTCQLHGESKESR